MQRQLAAFADGTRVSDVMMPVAKALTLAQRADVSANYAALPVPGVETATPISTPAVANTVIGAALATRGRWADKLPACEQCHGPGGRGVGSDFPPLAGQGTTYLASMNGHPPPLGAPELVALESYSYWLATGAPVDQNIAGRGYPAVQAPAQPADFVRGEKVYADSCVLCHGADGAGQRTPSGYAVFPAFWGPDSFNWGAGMGRISNAAGFIKANMPLALSGMLTDQQAWDVALYMNSHERPQDPRYNGNVQATRDDFHATEDSMYGRRVAGRLLGATGPPKPFRPSAALRDRADGP